MKEYIAPVLLVSALIVSALLVVLGPVEYRGQAMELVKAIIFVILGMFGGKIEAKWLEDNGYKATRPKPKA